MQEVIYPDGSVSTFRENQATVHDGRLAIDRLRLITAITALEINLHRGLEITHGGSRAAIDNVIAPLTGKTYKRSKNGKMEALADAEDLLAVLEASAVVYES